jgi:oxaloacetate decarboxylase alpha subunit
VYPVALTLHRVSGEAIAEALTGLGLECDVDVSTLWKASDLVDEYIGDEPVTPLAPRIAVLAAQHDLPASLVAALQSSLRAQAAADRLDEAIEELLLIRAEVGYPPLASPIGQMLGSQALLNVLSASRYSVVVDEVRLLVEGRLGTTPAPIDKDVQRAVALTADPESTEDTTAFGLQEVRAQAEGLASSEEELLLLGMFGDDAEPLLRTIRGRSAGDETLAAGGVDQARAERIRELVRIVQETGIGEVTIEESGMRVSVRRTEDRAPVPVAEEAPLAGPDESVPAIAAPSPNGIVRVEAPMVGTFYRAPQPGAAPFVEEGQPVGAGQTLCILEAMKLMNEVKADVDGIVRSIHVENAQPVEFGQLLFELEPVTGRPLDAL